MKRLCQTVLVGAAILCALVLSSSSTFALAARVGVPGWAHPFAVGLLEVVAVAGTWIWMTDPRLRLEAAAAVGMASTVTGIGGVAAYGWFGIVAPLGLIVTVHLIARAWTERRPAVESTSVVPASTETQAITDTQVSTEVMAGQIAIGYLDDVTEQHRAGEGVESLEDEELAGVRRIVARGRGRGTVAAELGVTPARARVLIDRVRKEAAA
ncbi:hypothetical protein ACFU8R_26445 [Pseudonocardia alni]|uniref:hypothetical protein n=1 Tax=Pseudonocardia alni TaxID=33907 RepID=UPI003680D31D